MGVESLLAALLGGDRSKSREGRTPWHEDEDLVHADGRFNEISEKLADELERLMREGQGKPDDAALCWGCVMTLLRNTSLIMIERHPLPDVKPHTILEGMAGDYLNFAQHVQLGGLLEKDGSEVNFMKEGRLARDEEAQVNV